ncbi:MAG TPA: SGNH/GDSL hydrolase family protein [Pyrinomonadaceae bacterium]|nr:SGNH/GDSL hydrolase family protein [Pyrinomonadaceae bacterium]
MKLAWPSKFKITLVTVLVFAFSTAIHGQTAPATDRSAPRDFNLLVLGDSILWGQGLKTEHKSWFLVKNWLEQTQHVTVKEKVEAHAGAVIGSAGTAPPRSLTVYGEVNSAWPTLHDQIDDAVRVIGDPSQIDLVLVDGCINDVNARRFLNAGNSSQNIELLAQEKCGAPVEALLSRVASSFPNAHIVVTGYYPVISGKTSRDLFMRTLAKMFYAALTPEARRPSDKELLDRLTAISNAWYEASNRALMDAVAKTNAELAGRASRQRVSFARIPFLPEHAFAARESRLWGFDATTARKMLAVLTLGKVSLHANDEVRSQRSSMCEDFFGKKSGETEDQKRGRKDSLMICRLAAIAHPNRKGAVMYADAITEQVQAFIVNTGWLRTTTAAAAAQ